jgi:alanine-glyoxylate transaminase/serine-glyoxylate transaminase/serine-pyruvate transaminase
MEGNHLIMKNRNLLMIPGPIEFEPAVLAEMGAPTSSHIAPNFIEAFGKALENLRHVFLSQTGQPFVLAGSGTLAMDCAAANLTEPGDRVVIVNTGYFGDRFGDIFTRYGAKVTHLRALVGSRPDLQDVEIELAGGGVKILTATHVDTSTGVLTDIKSLASVARRHGALFIVDGVCSVAGEELRMDDWGVDVAFTASQKAIGVPPGLALLVAGEKALQVHAARKSPVYNYYADWNNWLSIMKAYEARKPSYFGTPAVNLIFALSVSLEQILKEGLDNRINRHKALSKACKAACEALKLSQVPISQEMGANTMTAPKYPKGLDTSRFLPTVQSAGVTLAGGLHPAIKSEYFRIGHMGAAQFGDIVATISAIEYGLLSCGYAFEPGSGIAAAQRVYLGG